LCLGAVTKADLLFCYIDSNDCYGTLVEIGYALAQNVPMVIAFAPGVASAVHNDFWFACVKARWVAYGVSEQELPSHLMRAIRRYL
jgi:nucleoside 2-deoxyribosyltransferase